MSKRGNKGKGGKPQQAAAVAVPAAEAETPVAAIEERPLRPSSKRPKRSRPRRSRRRSKPLRRQRPPAETAAMLRHPGRARDRRSPFRCCWPITSNAAGPRRRPAGAAGCPWPRRGVAYRVVRTDGLRLRRGGGNHVAAGADLGAGSQPWMLGVITRHPAAGGRPQAVPEGERRCNEAPARWWCVSRAATSPSPSTRCTGQRSFIDARGSMPRRWPMGQAPRTSSTAPTASTTRTGACSASSARPVPRIPPPPPDTQTHQSNTYASRGSQIRAL